jgi:hypothetical protein
MFVTWLFIIHCCIRVFTNNIMNSYKPRDLQQSTPTHWNQSLETLCLQSLFQVRVCAILKRVCCLILHFSVLCGFHTLLFIWWITLRLLRTYIVHSGYAIPFLMGSNCIHHDYHHQYTSGNFGGTPLMDYLVGTYNDKWLSKYMSDGHWRFTDAVTL